MIRARVVLAVCAAAWAASVPSAAGQGADRKAVSPAAEFAFLKYLRSPKPGPTLVAFAPTNHDPRPGKHRKVPSADSVKADLEAVRPAFDGLVLYGFDKDVTPTILREAKRQGYRAVLLGVWNPKSEEELAGVAGLVKQYHEGLALAICVGNEGLTFNRYKLADVTAAAEKISKALGPNVRVPLTTTEPFGEYARRPLREFGHFLAPNIHPVFDQPKLGPAEAAAWTRQRAFALAELEQKPVLVKETGLPNGGDKRFTPAAQKDFWVAYLRDGRLVETEQHADAWVSHAAAFEAYSLPWKAEQTKLPMEGAWGLLSPERKPFPAFSVWQELRTSAP